MREIIGSFFHYYRVTDNLSLVTLKSVSSLQSKATEETNKSFKRCLNYLAIFLNGTITYSIGYGVMGSQRWSMFS